MPKKDSSSTGNSTVIKSNKATSPASKPPKVASNGTTINGSQKDIKKDTRFSTIYWIVLFAFIAALYYVCWVFDSRLPNPIPDDSADPLIFSEGRARSNLKLLTSFGPRPSGSEACEVHAKELIIREATRIRAISQKHFQIDIDLQYPSDCFYLEFLKRDFVLCYKNVTNIAVRLSKKGGPSKHSVLVNCHFDSVPGSPGGSDDGVSCMVMLELLNILAQHSVPLKYDIIFLFNGAEENFLQAAHGFITKHPWRHSIRTFINLEAAGAGDRELLFQTGPGNPWLSEIYLKQAPYPHASVMAQEIFDSGIVPSDTDFRIFRDFGRIAGLDIAFVKNGYVYHTEFDDEPYIPSGSIQRAGENVLKTLVELANSSFMDNPATYEHKGLVYFDVLGLFAVYYPMSWGVMLNVAIGVLILTKILWNLLNFGGGDALYSLKDFALALFFQLLGCLVVVGVTLAFVQIVVLFNLIMAWYTRRYFIILFYLVPGIAGGLLFHSWLDKKIYEKRNMWCTEQLFFDITLFLLAVILFVMTYFGLASAYIILMTALPAIFRDALSVIVRLVVGRKRQCASLHFFLHLVCWAIPLLFNCYAFMESYNIFIPIMGRSGSKLNPEYFIAGIAAVASIYFVLSFSSFVYMTHNIRGMIQSMYFVVVISYLICYFTSLSVPYEYSETWPTLRRLHLQHTSRRVYDMEGKEVFNDNGIWIVPLDYRGSADLPQYTFASASRPAPECCALNDTFCGLPYYIPVKDMFFDDSRWMQTPAIPDIPHKLNITLISKTFANPSTLNLTFSVEGPDHVTLFITPRKPWSMLKWSFTQNHGFLQNHDTFFVYLAYGRSSEPWIFSIVLVKLNSDSYEATDPSLTLGVASHFLHGEHMHSDPLKNLIKVVEERRKKAHLAYAWWRWLCTVQAWSSEYVARDY